MFFISLLFLPPFLPLISLWRKATPQILLLDTWAQIHRRSQDNLKTIFGSTTILLQLANSQKVYDNLQTYLKTKSLRSPFRCLKTAGPKFTDRPIVLRFILRYIIR